MNYKEQLHLKHKDMLLQKLKNSITKTSTQL